MEILGVGPLELGFIIIIALIVLGPKDMVAAGRTLGRTLRKIVTSPMWQSLRSAGQNIQELPTRLIREAGLEEEMQTISEIQETANSIDPRRISRSFVAAVNAPKADAGNGESALPEVLEPAQEAHTPYWESNAPEPTSATETETNSGQDPAPEPPSPNPQA